MREFKKRRNLKGEFLNIGFRALGVLALLLVTGAAVHAAWDMYGKLAVASGGQEAAEVELSTLKAQETQVRASVAEMSSARGVETQVRERFGVARPGEGEIRIVRDNGASTTEKVPSENLWQRIFHALFVW